MRHTADPPPLEGVALELAREKADQDAHAHPGQSFHVADRFGVTTYYVEPSDVVRNGDNGTFVERDPMMLAWYAMQRRDARRAYYQTQRSRRTTCPYVAVRRASPRRRGAGRPRATAARSSSRSGDSGDDGPGEPPPGLRLARGEER